MYENRRRAPPLPGLPPGAQQPAIPSPTSPHAFDIHHDLPISRQIQPRPLPIPPRPNAERPRGYSMHEQSRPKSAGDEYGDFSIGIGQANVHRSFSHLQTGRPTNDGWSPLTARPLANMQAQTDHSFASFASLNASDYWNEVCIPSFFLSEENDFKFNFVARVLLKTVPIIARVHRIYRMCLSTPSFHSLTFSSQASPFRGRTPTFSSRTTARN